MATHTRLAGLYLLGCLAAFGQSLGTINGTVQDQTGASLIGAEVAARAQQGGNTLRATTRQDGTYQILNVPVGQYTVRFSYPGFRASERRNVAVTAGAAVTVSDMLSAGAVSTEVSVSASAALLQPTRTTQSGTLTTQELISLPTASRNYTHLIVGEAGVSAPLPDRTGRGMNIATAPGTQSEDASQSLNPSVNGARPTNNALVLNGLDITNMLNSSGGLGNNITVPLDALETVEVQTALYAAHTGRNGGGNIQMITRGGTNEYHGSAYHFLQNEKLNANEFFLNRAGTARPNFRRNETGGTFGGPVFKDRTFFFGSVQRTDFLSGYATNAIAAAGLPVGLTDTRTRETIADVANNWLQSGARSNPMFASNFLTALRRFPAEQVPGLTAKFFANPDTLQLRTLTAQDIHPVAVNILNTQRNGQYLIPTPQAGLPLLPGTASFGQEYLLQQVIPTGFNSWSGTGTVDHQFGSMNRLRLSYSRSVQAVQEAFGWADASPSPTVGDTSSWAASLSDVHTFSPNWINELRGGFFELFNTRISKFRDITNSSLGIFNPLEPAVGGLASLMPTIDISTQRGSGGIGNAWDFFDRQRTINATNITSYVNGSHTVQFGGEWRRPTIKGEYMARTNGDLDYDNWVLFFTGHGASGGGSDLDQGDTRRHFKMQDVSWFVQDDWRVRRGLTLNVGLRWDYYGNPIEADGRLGNYYTASTAAALGVPMGFQVPANSVIFRPDFNPLQLGLVVAPGTSTDLGMVHKAKYESTLLSDRNNFAPRVGIAWQPRANGNLVLRAGYGIFYERMAGTFKTDLQTSAPFFMYQNVPSPADMANPYPQLNVNPFQIPMNVMIARDANGTPGWRRANGTPFPSTEPFNTKSHTFIDPFVQTPYVQQWTFNTQWEPWRGNLLDVRYVGSRGVGLLARRNLTQPVDPRQTPVNGFTDIRTATGAAISPQYFVSPEFLGLNHQSGFRLRGNYGQSTYHGLQVSLKRRYARGLTANVAYTWSKSIDNVSSDNAVVEHDANRQFLNRGRSDFDRAHRFTAGYYWAVPGRYESRMLRAVLGGWTQSGMITLQSGTPFSVLGNASTNAIWAQPSRVRLDVVPGKTLADAERSGRVQDRLDLFFDPSAFRDAPEWWGNSGRNILRGPAQQQFDFTLARTVPLREQVRAEFRWELYNAFNTPTFANPANTFATNGAGNAGRITATIGGPRTMQGAVRLSF